MYSIRPNLVLGFHGCDKETALAVAANEQPLIPSHNKYDWLGNGIYFWENDYERALEYAHEIGIAKPYVLGAIFHLGYCLDLTSRKNIELLKAAYHNLLGNSIDLSITNQQGRRGGINGDLLLRYLDCRVIEAMHQFNEDMNFPSYDSVKAAFWEGNELYPTAGFREKNHIQICIRNERCILGYFIPRT